jgi:hypothetical protein
VDRLLELKTALRAGAWQPARTVSFVVNHPKTREIHAPDFADRVVHHLLVERLEPLYEPIFIHDSYANRAGKGSHMAVDRLQAFMRQQNGRGWFLQLDIHNYFNSIHRPTLYGLLKRRIAKAAGGIARTDTPRSPDAAQRNPGTPADATDQGPGFRCAASGLRTASSPCSAGALASGPATGRLYDAAQADSCQSRQRQSDERSRRDACATVSALALQSLCHKLLVNKVEEQVADPTAAARIPPHKRLANAAPGCGLPVGNLTSQFFANVYLNELDQFVKHRLKCRRYLRYVDDFVLLADTREQLLEWQGQIASFLAATLRLKLKDDVRLGPLSQGVDFLGYLVFPSHRLVRPRVLRHCRAKIETWARRHVHVTAQGLRIRADAPALASLQAMLGSYWGHFKHADSARLRRALFARYPWLGLLFELDAAAVGAGLPAIFHGVGCKAMPIASKPAPTTPPIAPMAARVIPPGGGLSGYAIKPLTRPTRGGGGKSIPSARIVLTPRWVLQGETYARQAEVFAREWPQAWRLLQKGNRWVVIPAQASPVGAASRPRRAARRNGEAFGPGEPSGIAGGSRRPRRGQEAAPTDLQAAALQAALRRRGIPYVRAAQTGWLKHGTRRREIVEWFLPAPLGAALP